MVNIQILLTNGLVYAVTEVIKVFVKHLKKNKIAIRTLERSYILYTLIYITICTTTQNAVWDPGSLLIA